MNIIFTLLWAGLCVVWYRLGKVRGELEVRQLLLRACAVYMDEQTAKYNPHTATGDDLLNFEHQTLTGLINLTQDLGVQRVLANRFDKDKIKADIEERIKDATRGNINQT